MNKDLRFLMSVGYHIHLAETTQTENICIQHYAKTYWHTYIKGRPLYEAFEIVYLGDTQTNLEDREGNPYFDALINYLAYKV